MHVLPVVNRLYSDVWSYYGNCVRRFLCFYFSVLSSMYFLLPMIFGTVYIYTHPIMVGTY